MMLKEVESLSSQGEFSEVTETISVAKVDEMPVQPTIVGQETTRKGMDSSHGRRSRDCGYVWHGWSRLLRGYHMGCGV